MKKLYSFLIALTAALLLSAFTTQLIDTTLKVTVRNELGNLESGVTVSIYKTKEDYEKSANAVMTQTTNSKGNALFRKIEPIIYYISAEKGDRNNYGAAEKTEKIEESKTNKVTIIISE